MVEDKLLQNPQWWIKVRDGKLAQGDFPPSCKVPLFPPDFAEKEENSILVEEYDCIIVTQSCDLENNKVDLVALCPICSVSEYEGVNTIMKRKGEWEKVRKGRVESLHLIAGFESPIENQFCFVIDFSQIYSLPIEYLKKHAKDLQERNRLASPFLEHFSQAFARFFMRVGLPSSIPKFR